MKGKREHWGAKRREERAAGGEGRYTMKYRKKRWCAIEELSVGDLGGRKGVKRGERGGRGRGERRGEMLQ